MSNFSRQVHRHPANRQEPVAPPPTQGAVDLGGLKGGDKAAQRAQAQVALANQGFVCSCGARMEGEGIQAIGQTLGVFPQMVMTPQGPQQVMAEGAHTLLAVYHSRTCPNYVDALKNGIALPPEAPQDMPRPKILAVRSLPPVEWLDGPQLEVA